MKKADRERQRVLQAREQRLLAHIARIGHARAPDEHSSSARSGLVFPELKSLVGSDQPRIIRPPHSAHTPVKAPIARAYGTCQMHDLTERVTADELLAAGWRRWAGRYPGQVGAGVTARALLAHSGSWVGGWGGGEPAGSVAGGWAADRASGARSRRAPWATAWRPATGPWYGGLP